MKLLSLSLIVLFCSPVRAQAPKGQTIPAKDNSIIAGQVVKLAGSEPLRKATIRLQSQDDRARSISSSTDSNGRFEFKGIEPGRYRLTASKLGFVSQSYGQKTPSDPGAILALRAGQNMKDLLFRLIPSAVIAGRVIDEEGDPLPKVEVSAMRETYRQGRRDLASKARVFTNDLGEYRLFSLIPGRYFIRAEYTAEAEGSEEQEPAGYVPMYYPSSVEPSRANAITVKAGEEIPAVEILLRPVTTFTVRGRVYNLVSRRPSGGYYLLLSPRASSDWLSLPARNAFVDVKDDSFAIPGVLPGAYTLLATWFDEGKRYQAHQSIDIGNADVEGASLTISPGMTLSGRVLWEGQPSLTGNSLMVILTPTDMSGAGPRARTTPGWSFTLPDVYEGNYRVAIAGQSRDCYLKAVRYGGTDGLAGGFMVVRGTSSSLDLVVSCNAARLQGTVTDADNLPAVGVWVVLVPEATHRGESRLYKTSTTDQYGYFDFRGVVPGDYKLFSWEQVESEAWQDAEFLKPFEAKGEEVSLQEGDLKSINLTAIRTKAPEGREP